MLFLLTTSVFNGLYFPEFVRRARYMLTQCFECLEAQRRTNDVLADQRDIMVKQ